MSLALLFILLLWIATFGITLTVSYRKLASQQASLKDELVVRFIAAATVTITLGFIGLATATFSLSGEVFTILPIVWAVTICPLFIPPFKLGSSRQIVSSHGAVLTSIALSAIGGVSIAIFILVNLILTNPELI